MSGRFELTRWCAGVASPEVDGGGFSFLLYPHAKSLVLQELSPICGKTPGAQGSTRCSDLNRDGGI